MNSLRKENEKLRRSIVSPTIEFGDIKLAGLDEPFVVTGTCSYNAGRQTASWAQPMTWREMFAVVAPLMVSYVNAATVKGEIAKAAFALTEWKKSFGSSSPHMDNQIFLTISVQLKVLGLVKIDSLKTTQGGVGDFWKLTPTGEQLMLQERVVRSAVASGTEKGSGETE